MYIYINHTKTQYKQFTDQYNILITECEAHPWKYLPKVFHVLSVQTKCSKICMKDRGQIFSRTDRANEVLKDINYMASLLGQ